MIGGQITLNEVTDAQLETLLDVKKNNEGQFQLTDVHLASPPPFPIQPTPNYFPGSPWGQARGIGVWYGPGSMFGLFPPGIQPPAPPPPGANQQPSVYNVTVVWGQDQGLKAVAEVFRRLATGT